jgi:hypothetical protein
MCKYEVRRMFYIYKNYTELKHIKVIVVTIKPTKNWLPLSQI